MTRTLEILLPDIPKQMNPGENQKVTLVLRRIGDGDQLIGYHGKVEPDNPQEKWVRIAPDSVALDPIHPDYALVTLHLTVPPDATSGTHSFNVKFTPEDQSSAIEKVKINIEVPNILVAWLCRYPWLIILLCLLCILAAVIAAILRFNPGFTPQSNDNTTSPPTATVLAGASAATTPDPTSIDTAEPLEVAVRGIRFHYLQRGKFSMGNNNTTCGLPGFWIMETEVSNTQYRRVLAAGVCLDTPSVEDIDLQTPVKTIS